MRDDTAWPPDCLMGLDTIGAVVDWGAATERIFGWTGPQATGRSTTCLVLPVAQGQAFAAGPCHPADRFAAGTLNRLVDLQAVHRDGHRVPIECCAWPSDDGQTRSFNFSARDVSQRLKALGLMQQSEAHHRAVVEHMGEGTVVIQDERIVFANPQADEILRVPPGQLKGMRAIDLLHPDDRAAVAGRLAQRQAAGPLSARTEIRRLDDDGGVRWLETHSTNASWEGRPATMSFFQDVTQRKGVVEALRRSEERYRAVIEHVGDGMVVVKDQRFAFVNRRAAEIVQMTVDEMMREGCRLHAVSRTRAHQAPGYTLRAGRGLSGGSPGRQF